MLNYQGPRRAIALAFVLSLWTGLANAAETHVWQQDDEAEFTRGTLKNLSVRSDGQVTLAPVFKEIADLGVPYIWSVVEDSKGVLYCAGGAPTGATTKVFALSKSGKPQTYAELTGLEVHALALDGKDRLYAATSPDAKIYRIGAGGKAELFFDTKAKYAWSMVFDGSGNLYVATGDQGVIYRVTPDGKGSEFFHTEETHARSMILDDKGNLIVGTEPGGFVLRITPQGKSFVLFQSDKREITALAQYGKYLYAAASGGHPAPPSLVTPPVSTPAPASGAPVVTIRPSGQQGNSAQPQTAQGPPSFSLSAAAAAAASGGSELYRVEPDGFAQKLWTSTADVIYAIGFNERGTPLLGTGNKGIIYRVDSQTQTTQLVNAPPTQVTTFARGRNGALYAATGNVGKIYAIGPGVEKTGTLESDVLDAGGFARWGKIHIVADLNGGKAEMSTRSGNVSRPQKNWSDWESVGLTPAGGQVKSPAARFFQYRLTLTGAEESPALSQVQIAYLPKNIAPVVRAIEVADANYRATSTPNFLERATTASGSPTTLTLPPLGQARKATPTNASDGAAGLTLQYAKGFITVRWSATDENGDLLIYKVEIKGVNEPVWRLLKDRVQERHLSFDGSAFADGKYAIRVTASDEPSNTPEQELTGAIVSEPFTIDNTPPALTDGGISNDVGAAVIHVAAKDALNWIEKAEYSVNGGEWIVLEPKNEVSDSQELSYELRVEKTAGEQVVAVRVFDEDDNSSVTRFVVPGK